MLFDTHTHYDEERYNPDRHETIMKAYHAGVSYILNVSNCMQSSHNSVGLSQKYDFIYAAIGIHPYYAGELNDNNLSILYEQARNRRVMAIGEIGLDYHWTVYPKEMQKDCFRKQISLARELKLPILVHDRNAHQDVFDMLKNENAKEVGGILHSYSGSEELAKLYLKMNFHISLAGPVTYKNARRPVKIARFVPLDRLVIETDCPDIPPEPFRGTRNDSSLLRLVAESIARARGLSFEEVASATTANAKRLLKIE